MGSLARWARVAAPAPRRGVGGGRCNGRRTRPVQPAAADSRRSASDPIPPAGRCPPSAPGRAFPRRPHGVRSTVIPSAAKTASKAAVNFASRSRSRNWKRPTWPASSMSRFRACWVTHAPVGCGVTPSMWTRRLATSITNSTYRRWSNTVSTVKKSTASTPLAWARRNCRHVSAERVGAGRRVAGWPTRYWPRSWSRGGTAHRGCGGGVQVGFSLASRSTSAWISGEVLGRPRRCG